MFGGDGENPKFQREVRYFAKFLLQKRDLYPFQTPLKVRVTSSYSIYLSHDTLH